METTIIIILSILLVGMLVGYKIIRLVQKKNKYGQHGYSVLFIKSSSCSLSLFLR